MCYQGNCKIDPSLGPKLANLPIRVDKFINILTPDIDFY